MSRAGAMIKECRVAPVILRIQGVTDSVQPAIWSHIAIGARLPGGSMRRNWKSRDKTQQLAQL